MRALACVAAVVLLAMVGAGSTSAREGSALRDRMTIDMPDDFQGPQVHFMYVIPADGTDNQLDTNGTIEHSIERFQNWLLGQTGNQGLRIDTYHGAPDITFFRMPHTDAQAVSQTPWPLDTIDHDLAGAGFNVNKVYAVFYDGHSTWACGGGNAGLVPKIGAMYLQAWPTHDPAPCHAWGTWTTQQGYFDIGILHEILHAIGFVPACAPHLSQDGYRSHVNDSPTDLMYAPDATHTAGWGAPNVILDYNHDDYYRAHIAGCPDLSNSPYLPPMVSVGTTISGAGSVVSNPSGISCPPTCTAILTPPVTLTATPGAGQRFTGWSGSCSGTGTCTLNSTGSVTADFAASAYRRSLSLRLHAHHLIGSLRAEGGDSTCVAGVAVVVERRTASGWAAVRRLRTGPTGGFAVLIPKGRASYRALAPAATVKGQRCGSATSPVITTG
jgi:hypothetical protein